MSPFLNMVKFSKELDAQLIPEWKDAFVNYWALKKHIKSIKLARKGKSVPDTHYDFGRSIFNPICSFARKILSGKNASSGQNSNVLQVNGNVSLGENADVEIGVHESVTEGTHLFTEEDEVKIYLEAVNGELKNVNEFYNTKEDEFIQRGDLLHKQLHILVDQRQILRDRGRGNHSSKIRSGDSGFHFKSNLLTGLNSDAFKNQSQYSDNNVETQTAGVIITSENNGTNLGAQVRGYKSKTDMKIDIPASTPALTIAAIISSISDDLVHNPKKGGGDLNRTKIDHAEKMIRDAFVELYRGLSLLRTFSSLNMIAFTKILKKFDKVSNQQTSADFLKTVKRSEFMSSDKVVRLMDEVESLFTQHFANEDRKRTMKFLRPGLQKDSHTVTFFVGLFTGCFITLFCVYAILAHLSHMFSKKTQSAYMETIYPIFSMFALLSLHIFLYGCNLLMWKSKRINYNFIFEFRASTSLKYRDAFLICTCLMTSVVGAMVIHLILLSSGVSPHKVDFIPGTLLLCFVLLLICPLNILYRPTRYCFLKVIRNIVCSPFYKVVLVDFFMADQLTSQIPLLRNMESAACYVVSGSFSTHRYETCKSGKLYRELAYVISFAPYYWRAKQCARRWIDESNMDQLANLGKYASAMVAAGARLTYVRHPSPLWMAIVMVTSVVATVYQLYWDFVKDWGLLNRKSRNPWLRDDLVLKTKGIYYGSIVLNFILRITWVETVMPFTIRMFESRMLDFSLASLEVIRRGHWNFYRLENEHLNNVGKFRAVKTVPLPFRDTDSD